MITDIFNVKKMKKKLFAIGDTVSKKVNSKKTTNDSLEIAKSLSKTALDTKAEDLIVLDVSEMSVFADYFVIMSGRSTRHVQGLASAIEKKLSKKRLKDTNTEGLKDGHWVLLDFVDVIVHIFYKETRQHYNLEGLWHEAPRIDLKIK